MTKPLIAITGASSGIGLETAKHFSKAGHPLLLLSRNVDSIKTLNLPNTICASVDVTDAKALEHAIKDAEKDYGPVDCLVNNAGIMLLEGAATQSITDWQAMFNVNVLGVLNGIKATLASMKANNHGTIINISSIAAIKNFPNHVVYRGTKAAVQTITENLREEVASSDVRLISILPGAVETNLLSHTKSDTIKKDYAKWKQDMGGVLEAKNIADAILFAYEQPQNVCIREIVIAATRQES